MSAAISRAAVVVVEASQKASTWGKLDRSSENVAFSSDPHTPLKHPEIKKQMIPY